MSFRLLVALCFLLGFGQLQAQQLPHSNVYLFNLIQTDSSMQLRNPQFLTNFNPDGYNNHPNFFSDDELYLSVQSPYDPQPDLYLLDLSRKTKTRVTSTPSGEFSPARMPDYYNFSAVRQEIVGQDTFLRLWQFPVDRLTNGKPVFKYLNGIGYYDWMNSYEVVVFMVDSPNYLGIADTRNDQVRPLATNVGRCFKRMRNGHIVYVQKSPTGEWLLMRRNPYTTDQPQKIIETLPNSEDFALLDDGTFLMGKGSKLYKYNPNLDETWTEIADLRFYEIRNISRLALSGNGPNQKIAIVAD
ncbi:MAG: hypothetical protein R2824_07195 [Saprospiraceae bacterium]